MIWGDHKLTMENGQLTITISQFADFICYTKLHVGNLILNFT